MRRGFKRAICSLQSKLRTSTRDQRRIKNKYVAEMATFRIRISDTTSGQSQPRAMSYHPDRDVDMLSRGITGVRESNCRSPASNAMGSWNPLTKVTSRCVMYEVDAIECVQGGQNLVEVEVVPGLRQGKLRSRVRLSGCRRQQW
jgi:hypothetical protein